ncbi:hypothetical protein GEMRC1_009964 [Eukaryota sp. GEM-RC1]
MAYERIDYYPRFSGRLNNLQENLELFSHSQICDDAVLGELCSKILSQSDAISARFPAIMERILISARLKLSSLEIGTHNLSHITWTEQSTSGATWSLPNDLRLSNTDFDLDLDSESKSLLSMAILSSRSYEQMTADVANLFGNLREFTVASLQSLLRDHVNQIRQYSLLVLILIVVVISLSLFLGFYIGIYKDFVAYLLSGNQNNHGKNIIKQKVNVATVRRFSKHCVYALSVLFVILVLFFSFSVYSFLSLSRYPKYFSDIGRRSALVPMITSQLSRGCADPFSMETAFYYASNYASDLMKRHHELVPGLIHTGLQQTSLLFDSSDDDFDQLLENFNFEQNGMHSLLYYFVDNVKKFTGKEADIESSCSASHVQTIISTGHLLTKMSIKSIDLFFNFVSDQRHLYSNVLLIIFLSFIVTLVVCYFFVFRKMLSTLEAEEETTLSFLDMLSASTPVQMST